jgi:hypothetical protein
MFGLMALGLTVVMIYTLVKNALIGTQLGANQDYHGSVDLIIPIKSQSDFYLDPWLKNLSSPNHHGTRIKIFILIDGHQPSLNVWQELQNKIPFVEIISFISKPVGREVVPWMIEQIKEKITANVVIIGDPELVPTIDAFGSIGKLVSEKRKAYFVLPQTQKLNTLNEAIACLNPTLALASTFGFRKIRRNVSHPLVSISQGWMGMPQSMFKDFNWARVNISSWKEALAKGWELENQTYILAFGEKHLLRYYPQDLKIHAQQLGQYWADLWQKGERSGFWLYLITLFIWSFPVFFFFSHPFWSLGSIFLLVLYRFFTKIVFQESWGAMALHPFGALFWLGTCVWWIVGGLKSKYGLSRPT